MKLIGALLVSVGMVTLLCNYGVAAVIAVTCLTLGSAFLVGLRDTP